MTQPATPLAAGPVDAGAKPKLPGMAGIWIGIVLVVGGIVFGIVLVVVGVKTLVDGVNDLARVPIRGGGTVQIDSTGSQTVYAERPSQTGGSSYQTGTYSGYGPYVEITVIGPDGESVYFDSNPGSETYDFDGRAGVSIGSFQADVAGDYEIRAAPGENTAPYSTLAVGQMFEVGGIFGILGGVFGGGVLVLLGIIVIIVSAMRRSRARKRMQTGYGYPPYGGPGALPGWAPPPVAGAAAMPGGPAGWVPPPVPAPGWTPTPAPPPVAAPGAPAPWSTTGGPVPPAPPDPRGSTGPTWAPPPAPSPQGPSPVDAPPTDDGPVS